MNGQKVFKTTFIFLLVFFLFIYIASNAGFYEYKLNEKKYLTEEKIKEFEQDIVNGVEIDINNYLTDTNKNYDNLFTNLNRDISKYINKGFEEVLKYLFKYIDKSL
jgi:molecular chaperone GrpE (heat shock protein)